MHLALNVAFLNKKEVSLCIFNFRKVFGDITFSSLAMQFLVTRSNMRHMMGSPKEWTNMKVPHKSHEQGVVQKKLLNGYMGTFKRTLGKMILEESRNSWICGIVK